MERFKGTPGPWRWEFNPKHKNLQICGGRPMYDLIVMDFERYGMHGAAPRFNIELSEGLNVMERADKFGQVVKGREHHKHWFQSIDHPDAHLMVAAPDLLEALQAVVRVADRATVEFDMARAAIAKALNIQEAKP